MKKLLSIVVGLCFCLNALCYVDTVSIYSKSMKKSVKAVVITPYKYKKSKSKFPVVYLLHGYGGNYSNWISKAPFLQQLSSEYKMIIVCPDGATNSWYLDSPIDSSYQYTTHVAIEVTNFIDSLYPTISTKQARAITGLSMGGHGAMSIAIQHQQLFGVCGSMSGVLDLKASRFIPELSKLIGDTVQYHINWKKYSVYYLIDSLPKTALKIIIDCGVDDTYFNCNYLTHKKLQQLNIQHDYIERPGNHSWEYWTNSIKYQLLFFNTYFKKMNLN